MTALIPLAITAAATAAGSYFATKSAGGSPSPTPLPGPAAPSISDASVAAADREQSARLNRRVGTDQSMLTQGLGDNKTATQNNNVQHTTLLGGGA